jgi:hypothetical protein
MRGCRIHNLTRVVAAFCTSMTAVCFDTGDARRARAVGCFGSAGDGLQPPGEGAASAGLQCMVVRDRHVYTYSVHSFWCSRIVYKELSRMLHKAGLHHVCCCLQSTSTAWLHDLHSVQPMLTSQVAVDSMRASGNQEKRSCMAPPSVLRGAPHAAGRCAARHGAGAGAGEAQLPGASLAVGWRFWESAGVLSVQVQVGR